MGRQRKLTMEQATAIRESREKGEYLAQLYGISTVLVSRIRNNHEYVNPDPLELGNPLLDAHGRIMGYQAELELPMTSPENLIN